MLFMCLEDLVMTAPRNISMARLRDVSLNLTRIVRLSVACLGVGLLVGAAGSRASAEPPIKVFVDGDKVHFDEVGPQQMDGRILVPVRGVLEKIGAMVDWAPELQKVNCSSGDIDIVLHIGDKMAKVNGHEIQMDVPAQTIGGHTMVPLRFLSESLGAKVRWDGDEQTVFIMTSLKHSGTRLQRPDSDHPRDDPNHGPRADESDRVHLDNVPNNK
jgi:hypothetical protein